VLVLELGEVGHALRACHGERRWQAAVGGTGCRRAGPGGREKHRNESEFRRTETETTKRVDPKSKKMLAGVVLVNKSIPQSMTQKQPGLQCRSSKSTNRGPTATSKERGKDFLVEEQKRTIVCVCLGREHNTGTTTRVCMCPSSADANQIIRGRPSNYLGLPVSCGRSSCHAIGRYGDGHVSATMHHEHRICMVLTACQ
jgi:hypothetical protein